MAYAQLTWRESLRDIEVTLSANAAPLYAMGLRQAVRHHAGRCQRTARLAHLGRFGRRVDSPRQSPLPRRTTRTGRADSGEVLCPRCHHHRSVLEPIRLGAISFHQGGHQAAHLARFAWCHPEFHSNQRRQGDRRELRSDRPSQSSTQRQRLSRALAPGVLQRPQDQKDCGVFDQQHHIADVRAAADNTENE